MATQHVLWPIKFPMAIGFILWRGQRTLFYRHESYPMAIAYCPWCDPNNFFGQEMAAALFVCWCVCSIARRLCVSSIYEWHEIQVKLWHRFRISTSALLFFGARKKPDILYNAFWTVEVLFFNNHVFVCVVLSDWPWLSMLCVASTSLYKPGKLGTTCGRVSMVWKRPRFDTAPCH